MSDAPFTVTTATIDDRGTALGVAGAHTVVIDRPVSAGGGGLGCSGGELLHLAVAGCVSNDLFREGTRRGIVVTSVRVTVWGAFAGEPAVSTGIEYAVAVEVDPERSTGRADADGVTALIAHVDRIAEIPNSLRQGSAVRRRDEPPGAH